MHNITYSLPKVTCHGSRTAEPCLPVHLTEETAASPGAALLHRLRLARASVLTVSFFLDLPMGPGHGIFL